MTTKTMGCFDSQKKAPSALVEGLFLLARAFVQVQKTLSLHWLPP